MRTLYGYQYKNKRFITNEDQAFWVRSIFDWYVNKSMGPTRISQELNKLNVQTPMNNTWTQNNVKWILKNHKYVGGENRDEIVLKELFDKAQEKMKKRGAREIVQSPYDYPFSRILRCGKCGQAYFGRHIKKKEIKYTSYRCYNKGQCGNSDISGYKMQDMFLKFIKELPMNELATKLLNQWEKLSELDKKQFVQSFFKSIIIKDSKIISIEMDDEQ